MTITPNQQPASYPVHPDWPFEAIRITGLISGATGVPPGSRLACSVATPVGDGDLKTALRRLYSALGGHRGASGYDPSADELRSLYAGTATAASLMAKASSQPAIQPPAATTYVPPITGEQLPGTDSPAAWEAATGQKAEPAPKAVTKPASQPDATKLAELLAMMMSSPQIDEAAVRAIVDAATADKLANVQQSVADTLASLEPKLQAMMDSATRRVEITVNNAPTVKVEQAHAMLEPVLKAVCAGVTPMLVGPAGSGKTTLARQVAETLGRTFYMAARVTSEYKLTGFIDAAGKAVQTDFRRAYENGGVFLFDEIDASDADALTAFNAPLANDVADFPDGQVARHPDFVAIAAGNTFGRGASREYVGRQQLDAATLDRFTVFEVDYDEALELAIAGNDDWTRHVQKVRRAVEREKVRAIVSPRASISGAKLLAAGLDRAAVEEATIWKGMDEAQRNRVAAAMSY
jgi:cobaltochelatase CobS